jgi:hypothetical protein
MEQKEMHIEVRKENLKENGYLEEINVHERNILVLKFRKEMEWMAGRLL